MMKGKNDSTEIEQNNWLGIAYCLACKIETSKGGRACSTSSGEEGDSGSGCAMKAMGSGARNCAGGNGI